MMRDYPAEVVDAASVSRLPAESEPAVAAGPAGLVAEGPPGVARERSGERTGPDDGILRPLRRGQTVQQESGVVFLAQNVKRLQTLMTT